MIEFNSSKVSEFKVERYKCVIWNKEICALITSFNNVCANFSFPSTISHFKSHSHQSVTSVSLIIQTGNTWDIKILLETKSDLCLLRLTELLCWVFLYNQQFWGMPFLKQKTWSQFSVFIWLPKKSVLSCLENSASLRVCLLHWDSLSGELQ